MFQLKNFFYYQQICNASPSSDSSQQSTNQYPPNEPERILSQLATEITNAIVTNNKFMTEQPNNTNALTVNNELLNFFTTTEGYIDSMAN